MKDDGSLESYPNLTKEFLRKVKEIMKDDDDNDLAKISDEELRELLNQVDLTQDDEDASSGSTLREPSYL